MFLAILHGYQTSPCFLIYSLPSSTSEYPNVPNEFIKGYNKELCHVHIHCCHGVIVLLQAFASGPVETAMQGGNWCNVKSKTVIRGSNVSHYINTVKLF